MTTIWCMVPEIWSVMDREFLSFWTVFCHFTPLTTRKIKILKNWKKHLEILSFYTYTINDNHMTYGSWDMKRDRQDFLSFWTIFCFLTPLTTQNIKTLKKWKKFWRYYHFTHVDHKWQSYNVWFLRYEEWQTEFFVILNCFLPFYPTNNSKNQNFEKNEKKVWQYYHFTHMYHKWQSYDVWFLRYQVWQTEFFVILDNFLPIHPLKTKKNQNFQKMKKTPWRYHPFTQVYQKSR